MKNDWKKILEQLERGEIRAATYDNGFWRANVAVKEAILSAFREGKLIAMNRPTYGRYGGFVDKDSMIPRSFQPKQKIRLVPGGSSVRRGAYVAPGVVIMPPSYINVGAYIDEQTMVDSHVLVGSCAQVGKRVHLSAGVQIGGVLEPVGSAPVVIEDDAFVGADAVIVEGICVGTGAVIAPGVVLSRGVTVYDAVHEKELGRGARIPDLAVVVPGTRPLASSWAKERGLATACAIIVKYRDAKSNAALQLEEALR